MHGGAADRSGLIHVGDEVVEVNGLNVEGKTPADVLDILVSSEVNTEIFCVKIFYLLISLFLKIVSVYCKSLPETFLLISLLGP